MHFRVNKEKNDQPPPSRESPGRIVGINPSEQIEPERDFTSGGIFSLPKTSRLHRRQNHRSENCRTGRGMDLRRGQRQRLDRGNDYHLAADRERLHRRGGPEAVQPRSEGNAGVQPDVQSLPERTEDIHIWLRPHPARTGGIRNRKKICPPDEAGGVHGHHRRRGRHHGRRRRPVRAGTGDSASTSSCLSSRPPTTSSWAIPS